MGKPVSPSVHQLPERLRSPPAGHQPAAVVESDQEPALVVFLDLGYVGEVHDVAPVNPDELLRIQSFLHFSQGGVRGEGRVFRDQGNAP